MPRLSGHTTGGGGSSVPTVVSGGALGATETLNCSGNAETWLVGTLDANCVVTISNLASGCTAKLLLVQDATGGRSLTVSDGSNSTVVTIPTAASAAVAVDVYSDGTNLYVDVAGGTNSASGGTGSLAAIHKALGLAWDPAIGSVAAAPTQQIAYFNKVPVVRSGTISKVLLEVTTGGTGATALANCFVYVYNSGGTLIGKSADQAADWATAAVKSITVTAEAGQTLAVTAADAAFVTVGFHVGTQSTTTVQLLRAGNVAGRSNAGISTAADFRYATNSGPFTTTPAATVPTLTSGSNAWWVGVQ